MRFIWPLILAWCCFSVIAQEKWVQVKKNSNVSVYTKHEQGKAYKSVKAVGLVQSTPEQLLKVLDDISSYRQWFAYSKSVRLLKNEQNKKYIYMETSFPWPFRNEDMVYILSVTRYENGEIKFSFNGRPKLLPVVKGINRMLDANGYILLRPENEFTKVIYVMNTELSGNIPLWMANKYIHMLPFETLSNLFEVIKQ